MKLTSTLFFLILTLSTFAQNNEQNLMQKDGKIYVVIAVVLTILFGLIIYLFSLDKKITKLEKEIKKN